MLDDDLSRLDPAAPADYVPTSKAIRELVQSDARYGELIRIEETSASAEEKARARRAAAERLTELELCFFSAIDQGEIEVVVLDVRNNWRPVTVPGSYWHESIAGNESIWAGQLVTLGKHPPGIPSRMADSPVCLRQIDWSGWLAARRGGIKASAGLQPSTDHGAIELAPLSQGVAPTKSVGATPAGAETAPNDKTIKAWLTLEQARRIGEKAPCGVNEVRVYLRGEFPHLSRDDADRFYKALDPDLKPKRGPKRPWKNKQPQ